MNIFM